MSTWITQSFNQHSCWIRIATGGKEFLDLAVGDVADHAVDEASDQFGAFEVGVADSSLERVVHLAGVIGFEEHAAGHPQEIGHVEPIHILHNTQNGPNTDPKRTQHGPRWNSRQIKTETS